MTDQTAEERALAEILVEALDLEDIAPDDIGAETPLFGVEGADCLGLDSIDALEIALAIDQHYGVKLKADDESNKVVFRSLRSLVTYIDAHR
tara:strand:+ start:27072 stop:27347 length:276 start_codon:yes stop_codon:yes gene_type:complete